MDKRTLSIIAAVVVVLAILGYSLGWFGGHEPTPPAATAPAPATPPAATSPAPTPVPTTPAPATPAPAQ